MQVILRCTCPYNHWVSRSASISILGIPLRFRTHHREADLQHMDGHLYIHTNLASRPSYVGCSLLPRQVQIHCYATREK